VTVIDKASSAAPGALKMRVEGMDCGACALKIENALSRHRRYVRDAIHH
jgi:hypothetical protein